jgi:hypothetical protein
LTPKDVWTIRSDSGWSGASAIFQHLEWDSYRHAEDHRSGLQSRVV